MYRLHRIWNVPLGANTGNRKMHSMFHFARAEHFRSPVQTNKKKLRLTKTAVLLINLASTVL